MPPNTVAVVAAIVSIGSVAVAIWAASISKKALDHAIDVQDRSDARENDRAKADLLRRISDCRALLEKTRIEIGTAKANFDAEPEAVRGLMIHYNTSLFSDMYQSIQNEISQLDGWWDRIHSWKSGIPHNDLLAAQSTFYNDYHGYQTTEASAKYCLREFQEKLALAHDRASRAE